MPSQRRYPRTLRVNEVVREAIADELERMSDPRLEMVTVTEVKVSPDLRHATVWYSALGRDDDDLERALQAAAPRLRATLGHQVRLKYLPRLHFRADPSIETGQRVEEIIRGLRTETERCRARTSGTAERSRPDRDEGERSRPDADEEQ